MIQASPNTHRSTSSEIETVHYLPVSESPIDRILEQISKMEVPGREHVEHYMRHKWRMNHKPSTLTGSFYSVSSFLMFCAILGKSRIRDIVSGDIEAFIEHEQDRGLYVTTIRTRLNHLWAFLHFLSDREIIDGRILKRKIKLKAPDFLPRAIRLMSESYSVVLIKHVIVR